MAHAFLTALQNDERANYQLDVKFQELYLLKVVSLLQCHLSEGAILESDAGEADMKNSPADENRPEDLEEGELTNSSGEWFHFGCCLTKYHYLSQMFLCTKPNLTLQRSGTHYYAGGTNTGYLISNS